MDSKGADQKISMYWERLAIYIASVLLAICAWLFVEQKAKVDALEVKVQTLQIEKVSRQELKDIEDRLYKRMDVMKSDIIDRLDWYFAGRKSNGR